jgi:hydrogenase-4 component B
METLLLAEARAAVAASPSRDLIVLLAFSGFGVKAGAALVHFWLPLAHPVAPVPASAVLSGAMIKAGLLGWLHFLPFGEGDFPGWGALLVTAGYLAAFGGAAIGLTQREPKTVLAYSSVSQMGLITAALGTGLVDAAVWPLVGPAVAVFALNHALAKGALFLGVGVVQHAGAVRALAVAGAPWTGGAIAKHAAKGALGPLAVSYAAALPLLASLASVATTMLLARFVSLVSAQRTEDEPLRAGFFVPWILLVLCAVIAVPASVGFFALEIDTGELDPWTALWPVATGLAAYAAAARALRGRTIDIPPGDIVVPLERLVRAVRAAAARVPVPGPAAWQIDFVQYFEELAATEERRDFSRRLELRLTRWNNAGLAFAGVVIALALMVML